MNENKLQVISKIFESDNIRTIWNSEDEKYYVSIVDVVSILSDSKDGRKYWNKLKQRLKDEGNETVTNCHQLKLEAEDGKYRLTDVCDIEGMFRIIQSIPSKNAESQLKGLRKENLCDNMDNIELILTDLSEEATKRLAQEKKPKGLKANKEVARDCGSVAKDARNSLEQKLGKSVITSDNKLNYQYIDNMNENLINNK